VGWKGLRKEGLICERCGRPLVRIEYKRRGNRVYAYGLHRDVGPDGKVRWYYHYLGPADKYEYVTRLHRDIFPRGLKGAYYDMEVGPRRIDYLRDQVDILKDQMQKHTLPSKEAFGLADAIEALAGLVGELRRYGEIKAKEEQEQAKEEEDKEGEEQ
jgi:hypothetical protein